YLNAQNVDRNGTSVKTEDPFGLFQHTAATKARAPSGSMRRRQFYEMVGYDVDKAYNLYPVHKVPYSWDFGFLLCNRQAWERAEKEKEQRTRNPWQINGELEQSVGTIWDRLWKVTRPGEVGQAVA